MSNDYSKPILAYRYWSVMERCDPGGGNPEIVLKGSFDTHWTSYIMRARCTKWHGQGCTVKFEDCTCGIYAFKDLRASHEYSNDAVIGMVSLWGQVVVATIGYRAEWASIKVLASRRLPYPSSFFSKRYKCPALGLAGLNDIDKVRLALRKTAENPNPHRDPIDEAGIVLREENDFIEAWLKEWEDEIPMWWYWKGKTFQEYNEELYKDLGEFYTRLFNSRGMIVRVLEFRDQFPEGTNTHIFQIPSFGGEIIGFSVITDEALRLRFELNTALVIHDVSTKSLEYTKTKILPFPAGIRLNEITRAQIRLNREDLNTEFFDFRVLLYTVDKVR